MKILGIETSCDETAAALLEINQIGFKVVNNVVLSQTKIHKKYGGIVPEVAARAHVESIIPVIKAALTVNSKLQFSQPDLIAVTKGPGLITSLSVGAQAAKTLSYVWNIPVVGVNHLEGHLWSFLLNQKSTIQNRLPAVAYKLPAIALIVSGGHTELILVEGFGKYKLIGQTLDDAAGEAFDKVAKMLSLGYPGGPVIAHFAKRGDPEKIKFPRPMLDSADFNFSFSGLKTAVKYYLAKVVPQGGFSQAFINDVCASFQAAVIEVLTAKTIKAAEKFKIKSVILGGGVSANENLTQNLKLKVQKLGIDFYYPEKWLTGDNASIIALAGYFNFKKNYPAQGSGKNNWQTLTTEANLQLV